MQTMALHHLVVGLKHWLGVCLAPSGPKKTARKCRPPFALGSGRPLGCSVRIKSALCLCEHIPPFVLHSMGYPHCGLTH